MSPKMSPTSKEELQRLTAEALTTIRLPEQEIEVPQLGGTVLIKAFSGKVQRLARRESMMAKKGPMGDYEEMDEDLYEKALVRHGLIDPKLTEEQLDRLWDEQFGFAGRVIALAIMALNASHTAPELAKDSGPTPKKGSPSK